MTAARPLYTCSACKDTCMSDDGMDACPVCALKAEIEYEAWQQVGDVADCVVAKALEARRGRR